jgi:teichoic acid transport system permease protein
MAKAQFGLASTNTCVLTEHIGLRNQILRLAWLDLLRQYRGAVLSWAWAVIRPLVLLLTYWFVLKIGLKVNISKQGIDLFPWLAVGLVAWFYMQDVMIESTRAVSRYKYLVTKMKFPVSVIPTIVVFSNFITHLVLLAVVIVYLLVIENTFSVYWLQLPFYTLLLLLFSIFWGMFSAPLSAVSKDFSELIKSAQRILFWVSGILFNIRTVGIEWLQLIMMFNPITFFVEGYRNSLLYKQWFWEDWRQLAAFGVIFLLVVMLGIRTQKRTRKELVDAL